MSDLLLTGPARKSSKGKDKSARSGLGLRVLCVEDDEQVATVLAALLESEGFEVETAGTAADGLRLLRGRPFQLIVTDYWLPDRTGAWMLGEASSANLIGKAQVLVITAEHRPQGVENLKVLRKPLDLDDFLRVVHEVLTPARQDELERASQEVQRVKQQDGSPDSKVRVELTLYISASSPSSLKALRNLQRLLSQYDGSQVSLSVLDLSKGHSQLAEQDRIAFTPTLVKRTPEPKVWILGDLEDAEIVSDLLSHSGIERLR